MILSYRTRQFLRRLFSTAAVVLSVLAVVLLCLFLWLQRFLVYTEQGVLLDFDRNNDLSQSQAPLPEASAPPVSILFDDKPYQEGMGQLIGFYIDAEDLMENIDAVQAQLQQLEPGTAVLLDLKGYRGNFYYSTKVGDSKSSSYDIAKMDKLIKYLADSELYAIARISAFRDYYYGLNNTSCGLAVSAGYLWMDTGRAYWLDPGKEQVRTYLIQTVRELRDLGFDEVVLQNFCFPNTDSVIYKNDKAEVLAAAAEKLVTACSKEDFIISFSSNTPNFTLPGENCRLYLDNIAATEAQGAWDSVTVADKRQQLVFITATGDSRYDLGNGILRRLIITG